MMLAPKPVDLSVTLRTHREKEKTGSYKVSFAFHTWVVAYLPSQTNKIK